MRGERPRGGWSRRRPLTTSQSHLHFASKQKFLWDAISITVSSVPFHFTLWQNFMTNYCRWVKSPNVSLGCSALSFSLIIFKIGWNWAVDNMHSVCPNPASFAEMGNIWGDSSLLCRCGIEWGWRDQKCGQRHSESSCYRDVWPILRALPIQVSIQCQCHRLLPTISNRKNETVFEGSRENGHIIRDTSKVAKLAKLRHVSSFKARW